MARKPDAELQELRQLVRERQRAANKKVSRIQNVKRIQIRGSQYDPRRDLSRVDKYNKAQLKSYLDKLNTFTGRSTQFVMGANREPIRAEKWREYKRLERKLNERLQAPSKKLKDVKLPSGRTVGEMSAQRDRPGMRDHSEVIPLRRINRTSKAIVGERGLDWVMKDVKKRLDPDDFKRRVRNQRSSARKMAAMTGNEQLMNDLDKLSDEQFHVAWQYTDLPETLAVKYKELGAENVLTFDDDSTDHSTDIVQWASTLPIGRGFRNNN